LLSRSDISNIFFIAIHISISVISIYDLVAGKLSMAFNEVGLNELVLYLISVYIGLTLSFLTVYISHIDNFYSVCFIYILLCCVIIR